LCLYLLRPIVAILTEQSIKSGRYRSLKTVAIVFLPASTNRCNPHRTIY